MTNLSAIEAGDPTFVSDLLDSQRFVWLAARILSELGFNVTVRPTQVRPSIEQMSEFADDGDLEIIQRVEVKHRNIRFTSEADYPYPTVIVDVAHTWDRAKPKPYAYLVFNQDATAYLVIRADTRPSWVKTQRQDRGKGRVREFYECPKGLCRFYPVKGCEQ